MEAKTIYLARNGRVSGPFTQTQLADFRAQGKLDEYRWIWDGSSAQWQPLDPPPAPPQASGAEAAAMESGDYEALVHDYRSIISGHVRLLSGIGCEILCGPETQGFQLGSGAPVFLHLRNTRTGTTIDVPARMAGATRSKGGWVFRISWNGVVPKVA